MICFISPIDIAFAKNSLKRIVRTVRGIVLLELIVVTAHIDSARSQTRQEEAITTQSSKVLSEDVIAGFVNNQKPSSIGPRSEPLLLDNIGSNNRRNYLYTCYRTFRTNETQIRCNNSLNYS